MAPSATAAAIDLNTPVSGQTAVAPPAAALRTQQVGDWAVVCPVSSTDAKDCFLQQQLRTREQKQIVLVWTIRKDSAGVVHAVWEVPADVVHERGMVIDLADGKPKGLAFSNCTAQTCTARAVLASDYVQSIEGAARIDAAVSAPGKAEPVRFALSSVGLALGMV
jgi:invasion protein IalB